MAVKLDWHVLTWIPNVIGYVRVLLCILAVFYHYEGSTAASLVLFLTNFSLDGIDGVLARNLGQTSRFGTWFDLFIDHFSRCFLWILVNGVIGYAITTWEWLCFFSIHNVYGRKWKSPTEAPDYVRFVMKNNFKTVQGFYIVGSFFILPSWCYLMVHGLHLVPTWLTFNRQWYILVALICGRFLAASLEFWYISMFIKSLLTNKDEESKTDK